MKPKSRVRLGLVLLNLVLFGVVAFVVLKLTPLLANRETRGAVEPTVAAIDVFTDAEARASTRARAWADDAVLVRAETGWRLTSGGGRATPPALAWTFTYYAPSKGQLVTVAVDGENLLWGTPMMIPVVPAAVEAFPPAYGPDLAWISFRGAGGDAFLEGHPGAAVKMQLQSDGSQAVWLIVAADQAPEGVARHEVTVDAGSGIVLAYD